MTTILAISDQHGHLPDIPPCDLLIVAGDLAPDLGRSRQRDWFERKWVPWRYRQPVDVCVVTWGNHDFCGLESQNCTGQLGNKVTHVVCDNTIEACGLRIYLTPWSNRFMNWAFQRNPEELARVYANIPYRTDILVSHQAPLGYGSECTYYDVGVRGMRTEHVGSVELLAAIRQKQPRAVICGHSHSGYGTYDCDGIPVYNVSVVDEGYSLIHAPTLVHLR